MPIELIDNRLELLSDKVRMRIDNIFDPMPTSQEPHEIISKLHESYNALRRKLSENKGEQENQIINLCEQLIGDVADIAVMFERSRQKA